MVMRTGSLRAVLRCVIPRRGAASMPDKKSMPNDKNAPKILISAKPGDALRRFAPPDDKLARTVWVTGLTPTTSRQPLVDAFRNCGAVESVDIVDDLRTAHLEDVIGDSGRVNVRAWNATQPLECRRAAFVTFADEVHEPALQLLMPGAGGAEPRSAACSSDAGDRAACHQREKERRHLSATPGALPADIDRAEQQRAEPGIC